MLTKSWPCSKKVMLPLLHSTTVRFNNFWAIWATSKGSPTTPWLVVRWNIFLDVHYHPATMDAPKATMDASKAHNWSTKPHLEIDSTCFFVIGRGQQWIDEKTSDCLQNWLKSPPSPFCPHLNALDLTVTTCWHLLYHSWHIILSIAKCFHKKWCWHLQETWVRCDMCSCIYFVYAL